MKVNNAVYEKYGLEWWKDDAGFEFTSLRYCMNPARCGYFRKSLKQIGLAGRRLLDVGCGGGYLSEEFARDGFEVVGVDPAAASIEAARAHAIVSGLEIGYHVGRGESLPFEDRSFDVVACCDVLEHVEDPGVVIREVARVLRPGGVFLFDTVNRTFRSRVVLICVWQDLNLAGLRDKNMHVWDKFIRPEELTALVRAAGLQPGEMNGLSPTKHPLRLASALLRVRRGVASPEEIANTFQLKESDDCAVSYMGWAVKPSAVPSGT